MRSSFEDKVIKLLNEKLVEFNYEPFSLTYSVPKVYIPDIQLKNGIIVELKGYFRIEDMEKMRAIKASHPHLDIRIVFQDNPNSKNGIKYSKWCKKYGFQFAFGEIPEEWINEKLK